jgi:preprotein translocase subunit YajC
MLFLNQSNAFTPLLFLGLMVVVFYFLIMRPQQKRNKERNNLLSSLKEGDSVVTIGGVNGTIERFQDDKIVIRVSENVSMTFEKFAVNHVVEAKKEN